MQLDKNFRFYDGPLFRQDRARSGWYGCRQAYSTRYSQAVSHPNTNQARPCLVSERWATFQTCQCSSVHTDSQEDTASKFNVRLSLEMSSTLSLYYRPTECSLNNPSYGKAQADKPGGLNIDAH